MKYLIITIYYILMPVLAAANALPDLHGKHYEDFEMHGFGRLPRFWGQEVVFTPEAHRWLAQLKQEGYAFYEPSIGAWDNFSVKGESVTYEALRDVSITRVGRELREELEAHTSTASLDKHGRDVLHLAIGAPPFGVSVFGRLNFMINDVHDVDNSDHESVLTFFGATPDLLNISLSTGIAARELRAALSDRTTIAIAADNNPFVQTDLVPLASRTPIVVGASNPRGEISIYSSSTEVNIYAPGEHLSLDSEVRQGTSYAAPMVTGALADMFAILPPNAIASFEDELITTLDTKATISLSEFRSLLVHMLQETSTSTAMANSNTGGGVLNHYKLLRVAHRIAQQVGNSDQSVEQLIEDSHMYDFSAEAQQLYDEAMRLRSESGENQQEVLFKLREAVALDQHNHSARRELAEIYAQAGYASLSEFYAPPVSLQQLRTHRMIDLNLDMLPNFKSGLLEIYTRELDTPELIRNYLDKDILLAVIWASIHHTDPNDGFQNLMRFLDHNEERAIEIRRENLSVDSPWQLFDPINPLPFIISYSGDVQQAKQLVDAVLERFGISDASIALTLPSVTKEFEGVYSEEVIEQSVIEIDTDFLLESDILFYISDEARTIRQLPEFAGQQLNLIEWSILHDSSKLFAYHHEQLEDFINDDIIDGYETLDEKLATGEINAEMLALSNRVAAELEGHIGFTVQHTDNSVALEGLLDLHQRVSSESNHLALLRRQFTNRGLMPQLQQILTQRLRRLPVR